MSWRSILQIHAAAELFPLLAPDELRALGEDIKRNGLKHAAVFIKDKDGRPVLLDGRNRLDALELLGEEITLDNRIIFEELPADTDACAYIISANIHRRHLTAEQRRDLIAKLIKAEPTKSNRQIAATVRASHPHVAKVRAKLEKAGDVETVTTSVDTKGRVQPATKPPSRGPTPAQQEEARRADYKVATALAAISSQHPPASKATAIDVGPNSAGEVARLTARIGELEAENHRLKLQVAGLERELKGRPPPPDDGIPTFLQRTRGAAS